MLLLLLFGWFAICDYDYINTVIVVYHVIWYAYCSETQIEMQRTIIVIIVTMMLCIMHLFVCTRRIRYARASEEGESGRDREYGLLLVDTTIHFNISVT